LKDKIRIIVNSAPDIQLRPPVSQSLGLHVKGYVAMHVDTLDPATSITGVLNRLCAEVPTILPHLKDEFRAYCLQEFKKTFTPLSTDMDRSFLTWVLNANYPDWRKKELIEIWERCHGFYKDINGKVKCFIKDEFYMKYALARGIYSRVDEIKVDFGPYAKLMENEVYKLANFIKHVPVDQRPAYIQAMLGEVGVKFAATDYVTFEAHFTRTLQDIVEFTFIEYMLENLDEGRVIIDMIKKATGTVNHCQFKHYVLKVLSTRMSGEMFTSLFNGLTNLYAFKFNCHRLGIVTNGVVEGDDGLFACHPRAPTEQEFREIGFNIKIENHEKANEASFCGLIFDPEDKINITDPREVLLTFGWSKQDYVGARPARLLELLRAKGLSFAHQYAGCPIIQSLAHCALRQTKHIDMRRYLNKDRSISMWDREQLQEAMKSPIVKKDIPMNTRDLMARKFGIPTQIQIEIENYLDNHNSLDGLDHWSFSILFDENFAQNWIDYVSDRNDKYPNLYLDDQLRGHTLREQEDVITFTNHFDRHFDRRLVLD